MLTRIHPGNGKTNEHGNWHLRYYFPKGTDFREVSEEELQDVVAEINTRPRKILGYMTAQEKFDQSSFAGIPGRKSGEEEHSRFGGTFAPAKELLDPTGVSPWSFSYWRRLRVAIDY